MCVQVCGIVEVCITMYVGRGSGGMLPHSSPTPMQRKFTFYT